MEDKEKSHESYGILSLYRVTSGRNMNFFGSDLTYGNYVELELKRGEVYHKLGGNWFNATGPELLKIRLTFAQWAEFVSSFGIRGIPCTIESINGKRIENPPSRENLKILSEREVENKLSQLFESTEELIRILKSNVENKKSLGKKDQEDMISTLERIKRTLTVDLEFYKDQFKKETEMVVTEAKTSIDAFITNTLINKGIEGFRANLSLQSSENKEDDN
ncbi:MAG: hypothetical protein EBU90_01790 [Proteobacteria bacterium]|nr:hypothetical protein [Pseudomonadota bacterium]